jgi:hypothetical protein
VDLKLPNHIDPGHAVGEDGKRYLFLNGGDRVRLTDDGLATDGPVEHVRGGSGNSDRSSAEISGSALGVEQRGGILPPVWVFCLFPPSIGKTTGSLTAPQGRQKLRAAGGFNIMIRRPWCGVSRSRLVAMCQDNPP